MKVSFRFNDSDTVAKQATVNFAEYNGTGELVYGFNEYPGIRIAASKCNVVELRAGESAKDWVEVAKRMSRQNYPSLTNVQWMVLFGIAANPSAVVSLREFERLNERGYLAMVEREIVLTDKAKCLLAAAQSLPEPVEKINVRWEMPPVATADQGDID